MSDLDIFSGSESGNTSFSPEKYQEFLGKMREAAAQIKELKKGEQRQKAKEDKLAKIIAQFIKTQSNSPFAVLIIKLLSKNLPPVFILSLISISFPEIREITETQLLTEGQNPAPASSTGLISSTNLDLSEHEFNSTQKIDIDKWLADIKLSSQEQQNKINTFAHNQGKLHSEIIDLAAISLENYITGTTPITPLETYQKFCHFALHSIITIVIPPKLQQEEDEY